MIHTETTESEAQHVERLMRMQNHRDRQSLDYEFKIDSVVGCVPRMIYSSTDGLVMNYSRKTHKNVGQVDTTVDNTNSKFDGRVAPFESIDISVP